MYCKVLVTAGCRDNYDKEMKEKSGQRLKVVSKAKRPDQQTYVVPSARDSREYLHNVFHCFHNVILVC